MGGVLQRRRSQRRRRPGQSPGRAIRVQLLDAGLLCRVPQVLGRLPGFQALKGDALDAEQDPQASWLMSSSTPSPPGNRPAWPVFWLVHARSHKKGLTPAISTNVCGGIAAGETPVEVTVRETNEESKKT